MLSSFEPTKEESVLLASMAPEGLSSNTNSLKARFARRFLRYLMKIRAHRPTSLSSEERSRRIKTAAYSSMALVVGSKRAWSRAVICKLRSRARNRQASEWKRSFVVKKKRVAENKPPSGDQLSQADKLRRLVPGGEGMDFCNLLEETAHYIKCLATQVNVMQSIADLNSS